LASGMCLSLNFQDYEAFNGLHPFFVHFRWRFSSFPLFLPGEGVFVVERGLLSTTSLIPFRILVSLFPLPPLPLLRRAKPLLAQYGIHDYPATPFFPIVFSDLLSFFPFLYSAFPLPYLRGGKTRFFPNTTDSPFFPLASPLRATFVPSPKS